MSIFIDNYCANSLEDNESNSNEKQNEYTLGFCRFSSVSFDLFASLVRNGEAISSRE